MPKERPPLDPAKEGVRVREAAFAHLARRDHTVGELRRKLLDKDWREAAVDEVIADLIGSGLLDDRRFARRWVEVRLARKPAGRRKFAEELNRKHVARELIDAVLDEFAEELASAERAAELLRRQAWRYQGIERAKARNRMMGLLARRGYDSTTAQAAIELVWQELIEE